MPESRRGAGKPRRDDSALEHDCWMRVYEEYSDQVRRYFARRVKCSHDVDDLVQNVFADLLGHCRHLSNPLMYVRSVARHQLSAYWRHRQRSPWLHPILSEKDDDLLDLIACSDPESDPLERLLSKETAWVVNSMMASLTPVLTEALQLKFFHGLNLDEAAARAGCSRETLKKRLTRARRSIIELHS